jgi:hypothetical protein
MKITKEQLGDLIREALYEVEKKNTESPSFEEEEEDDSDKPKVISVTKSVMTEGGFNGTLEEFYNASVSEIMPGTKELSVEELVSYINKFYGVSIADGLEEDPTIEDVEMAAGRKNIGQRENTYNSSWWGPTCVYQTLGPATEDPNRPGVVIVSKHMGGDVRSNYAMPEAFLLDSVAEEAPWYSSQLMIDINTDQGDITLDSEGTESSHFYVYEGFELLGVREGSTVTSDEVEKELDWSESKENGIW